MSLDEPLWHLIRRSLIRSRVRLRTLLALLHLGKAYIADVAREARTTEARVRAALYGDGDDEYNDVLALVALGLVAVEQDAFGDLLSLTSLGEKVAKVWMRESMRALVGARREAFA